MPVPGYVRPAAEEDLPSLRPIVDEALFPGEMLAEMIAPFLRDPDGEERWLVFHEEGKPPSGVAYFVPEKLTEGTWKLLVIAVDATLRSAGVGAKLMQAVEDDLAKRGARLLIVDTSGTPAFDRSRAFYQRLGYVEEARIAGYWAEGDDKVTFTKRLQPPAPSSG